MIKISDYGIIKKADIKFKDGLNLLIGGNKTGKTTVIDYIKNRYDAKSILDLSEGEQVSLLFEGLGTISNKCILIDEVFSMLDIKRKKEILTALSKSKNQSIITMLEIPKIKANIINTKNFILKSH